MSAVPSATYERRFSALNRLFGHEANTRLAAAHVMVVGIGGVGSWCVEALARNGVGHLSLIDMDHIAESNINRQLPALGSTVGKAKIDAMAERIADINPLAQLSLWDDFISADNVADILQSAPDVLIDCTDQVSAKMTMVVAAKKLDIPVIVCGAAGGKTDALALRAGDLSVVTHDALLARLRNQLRRFHHFPRPPVSSTNRKKRTPKMQVQCLWVEQNARMPTEWSHEAAPTAAAPQGLSCAGYGSAVTVTAPMGFAAAQLALQQLLATAK